MAAKIALVFVAAFVLFQVFSLQSDAAQIRRDTAAADATKKNDLEEAFNSLKQGIEDFVKKVQDSEIYQNAGKAVDDFGKKLKNEGDQLLNRIKTDQKN